MRNFQYAVSSDPEVLAAARSILELERAFEERVEEWAAVRGMDPLREVVMHHADNATYVLGFTRQPENPIAFGRWTSGSGLSRPYESNRAERSMLPMIRRPDLPGYPTRGQSTRPRFSMWGDVRVYSWFTSATFSMLFKSVHEFAWGPQWQECLGSEVQASLIAEGRLLGDTSGQG